MRPSNIYLKQKSASFLSKLVGANLTRTHALMAYNTMFIPAMIYGLPATNVDLDKLKCIQDTAVQKFLSSSGFNNTFPRAACFAPKKFGGLRFTKILTEANLRKIESVVSHIRAKTTLGQVMIVNMNWIQMVTGNQEYFLTTSHCLRYIEKNLFLEIRDFPIQSISTSAKIRVIYKEAADNKSLEDVFPSFQIIRNCECIR